MIGCKNRIFFYKIRIQENKINYSGLRHRAEVSRNIEVLQRSLFRCTVTAMFQYIVKME